MLQTEEFVKSKKGNFFLMIGAQLTLAFLFWATIAPYLRMAGFQDYKKISTIISVSGICLLYIGRFTALYFLPKSISVTNKVLMVGTLLIVTGISYLIGSSNSLQPGNELFLISLPVLVLNLILLISGILIKILRIRIATRIKFAEAAATHSQSELQLLQSQLSPHFLFNTLNNLYGLSLNTPQKIPNLLLKLADLLRYAVYEAKEELVFLSSEIEYLHHYIEFEKIRLGERLIVTEELENDNTKTIKIAPMILIVFLENAFKHSKNTQDDKIAVEVNLQIRGGSILYQVKNSYNKNNTANEGADLNKGFGLKNVKKRLDLLYPYQHELEITEDGGLYAISLRLNIRMNEPA